MRDAHTDMLAKEMICSRREARKGILLAILKLGQVTISFRKAKKAQARKDKYSLNTQVPFIKTRGLQSSFIRPI